MKIHLLIALLFFCVQTQAQHVPQYNISVTLNDDDHSLDGFLSVDYTNNSTDSIRFLWFNIYPNAFKSDRTAFSEYMLASGRTDFYFSKPSERGYINRLDFRSGENILKTEDHPQFIDVIKVLFEKPLAPGDSKRITTPFHVKLPYNFNGIGYKNDRYDLRYWYPAVADHVQPLTKVDSSSNLVADYMIKFAARKKNIIICAFQIDESSSDTLKTITISASSVKDIPVEVIKREDKIIKKPASSEHDIFKFLSHPSKNKTSSSITDSLAHLVKMMPPILPAIGYNEYDGFQLGLLIQNMYGKNAHPKKKIDFYIAPVYTFRSKSVAGIAGASYHVHPKKYVNDIDAGFTASSFSYNDGVDANNEKVFARLYKVVPFVKVTLPSRSSSVAKTVAFKSYIMNERDLKYVKDSVDPVIYQQEGSFVTRYVNELTFDYSSSRILYPYSTQVQVHQANNWYRVNATGNYFFNYPRGGGVNLRLFAAKFGYIGNVSSSEKFRNLRYMPKLTAVRGSEDYTYSNYFIGRNNFDGLASRQIMMRDGGLKLRTDLFEGLQGRSDNWIASVNFNTSVPQIFPVKIPLKVFFDAGTFSEAWDDKNPNPRFLYAAGLQLSLFREILNVYAPVFYSRQFRDQLKSVPEENKFLKKVSFSIDIQKIDIRKLL